MDEKEKKINEFFGKFDDEKEQKDKDLGIVDISSSSVKDLEEQPPAQIDISSFSDSKNDLPNTNLQQASPIKEKKPMTNKRMFRFFWIIMIVLGSISIVQYTMVGVNDMLAVGREENEVTVKIPENANISSISKILKENKVINNESFFGLYSLVTKAYKSIGKGTYTIRTNMDYEAIISHLENQSNRQDIVSVTFREGLNIEECAALLEEKRICNAKDFLALCASNEFDDIFDFLKNVSTDGKYYKLEGYLFPDTYNFYDGENPKQTIRRFLYNYYNKVYAKSEVEGYDKKISIEKIANEKGKDINEVLIVASLIQAEAANEKDMYNVSSVIYNRLATLKTNGVSKFGESGMKCLGVDSTVWYPYRSAAAVPANIKSGYKSKYDTYSIEGLPAGPICNPGLEAIMAALNPNSTDYYYFCHSSKGTAYYAKTLNEHNNNLAKAGLT